MWSRVDHGLWPWIPPIGYMPAQRLPGVKLVPHAIDTTCSKVLQEIFERYATGAITRAEISRDLKKRQIKNFKGTILQFTETTLLTILNNEYYIGYLKHKDGRLIKGLHEPLISPELYQKCQNIQKGVAYHWTRKRLVHNPDFPLRRFVKCSFCNGVFTACWAKGKRIRYPYYYCVNKDCPKYGEMKKQSDLHNEFFECIARVKPKEEFIALFKEIFVRRYEERKKEFKGDYLRKLDDIKQLEQEQVWLVEKGKKGIIPDSLLQKQLEESEQKITLAKINLNEIHNEELEVEALLSEAEVFIRTPELAWYGGIFEAKLKYQRMIFPEGISYPFGDLSNTKIGRPFKLINDFASSYSSDVTPREIESRFAG